MRRRADSLKSSNSGIGSPGRYATTDQFCDAGVEALGRQLHRAHQHQPHSPRLLQAKRQISPHIVTFPNNGVLDSSWQATKGSRSRPRGSSCFASTEHGSALVYAIIVVRSGTGIPSRGLACDADLLRAGVRGDSKSRACATPARWTPRTTALEWATGGATKRDRYLVRRARYDIQRMANIMRQHVEVRSAAVGRCHHVSANATRGNF